ncbi:hypothetical protein ROZALSC1DRAFT_27769 [Rozella allomycis CSF55]|uniref:NadR/Ttd14 AAA domain-containing protein n=1 Tax=Rozella allomycis (strain CSF55) TaxID=988480 RepID=A0A4P9YM67_ROZAC|nr:hypothetical protein ROZALSC1DRAFT_27769 [Rozella allomycis CSF55]
MLENMGWKVYKISETSTILLSSGVEFSTLTKDQQINFQMSLLKVMITIEDSIMELASSQASRGQNVVVICDRGTMDPSAYVERMDWIHILQQMNMAEAKLRDERYDFVIHMVSAANGAEKFYGNETNSVRSENMESAKILDQRILEAWNGHPSLHVIDNSTPFDQKLKKVVETVLLRLGLEDRRGGKFLRKRKFLLKGFPTSWNSEIGFRDFHVEHNYLISTDGSQARIRKRGIGDYYTYTLTIRKNQKDGQTIEVRRTLTPREYEALYSQRDPSRSSIIKTRRVFIWENHYFHIDKFHSPAPGLVLMEGFVDKRKTDDDTWLPSFVKISADVTGMDKYSMYYLSLKEKQGM